MVNHQMLMMMAGPPPPSYFMENPDADIKEEIPYEMMESDPSEEYYRSLMQLEDFMKDEGLAGDSMKLFNKSLNLMNMASQKPFMHLPPGMHALESVGS